MGRQAAENSASQNVDLAIVEDQNLQEAQLTNKSLTSSSDGKSPSNEFRDKKGEARMTSQGSQLESHLQFFREKQLREQDGTPGKSGDL